MKITNRSIHRDLAFFYVGLIIAFSFSGIVLNHREDWYPMDYTYDSQPVSLSLPSQGQELSQEDVEKATQSLDLEYDGHRVRDGKLRVYFKGNVILDADAETGVGSIEYKRRTPFLGHTMVLHKSTSNFWIWYSDIFGLAMLIIAITGILIPLGKRGFKGRGWKLALAGLLFPLLFLFLFS